MVTVLAHRALGQRLKTIFVDNALMREGEPQRVARTFARLAASHPIAIKGVEIMAYHNMGQDKAVQIGRQPSLQDLPTASDAVRDGYLRTLCEMGCHAVVG